MESTLTLPTVHLNGTGHRMLDADYDAADVALVNFQITFGRIEFNARDYYPQGPDAYQKAREERSLILVKIGEIKEYLAAHIHAIDAQAPRNPRGCEQPPATCGP